MSFWKSLFSKSSSREDTPPFDSAAAADPSTFECKRCHKVSSHRRASDQYAGDLWICPSCGYKTPRWN